MPIFRWVFLHLFTQETTCSDDIQDRILKLDGIANTFSGRSNENQHNSHDPVPLQSEAFRSDTDSFDPWHMFGHQLNRSLATRTLRNNRNTFAHKSQESMYVLLRSLSHDRLLALDERSSRGANNLAHQPLDFAWEWRYGWGRGSSIDRWYLRWWMRQKNAEFVRAGRHFHACLEIGDGHFIRSMPGNWWLRAEKLFTVCDETQSGNVQTDGGEMVSTQGQPPMALDLSDPAADIFADLEDVFGTAHANPRRMSQWVLPSSGDRIKDDRLISPQQFDFIVCLKVLEHVRRPWRAMQSMAQLLRPGGLLLVAVPAVSGEPIHDPEDHFRFTVASLRVLGEDVGLRPLEVRPLGNLLTSTGAMLELSAEDFTEAELLAPDPYRYSGVYAEFQRP